MGLEVSRLDFAESVARSKTRSCPEMGGIGINMAKKIELSTRHGNVSEQGMERN
jgi:hypothetical protein